MPSFAVSSTSSTLPPSVHSFHCWRCISRWAYVHRHKWGWKQAPFYFRYFVLNREAGMVANWIQNEKNTGCYAIVSHKLNIFYNFEKEEFIQERITNNIFAAIGHDSSPSGSSSRYSTPHGIRIPSILGNVRIEIQEGTLFSENCIAKLFKIIPMKKTPVKSFLYYHQSLLNQSGTYLNNFTYWNYRFQKYYQQIFVGEASSHLLSHRNDRLHSHDWIRPTNDAILYCVRPRGQPVMPGKRYDFRC